MSGPARPTAGPIGGRAGQPLPSPCPGTAWAWSKKYPVHGDSYDDARATVAKNFPEVFEKVKIISYTQNIPNDVVAVRKNLNPTLKQNIREGLKYLAKTPEGSKVLKKVYGISGLADLDAFFDPVREAGKLLGLDLGHSREP